MLLLPWVHFLHKLFDILYLILHCRLLVLWENMFLGLYIHDLCLQLMFFHRIFHHHQNPKSILIFCNICSENCFCINWNMHWFSCKYRCFWSWKRYEWEINVSILIIQNKWCLISAWIHTIYFCTIIIFYNNAKVIFFCDIWKYKSYLWFLCNLYILRFFIWFRCIIPYIWGYNSIRISYSICCYFYKNFLSILLWAIDTCWNACKFRWLILEENICCWGLCSTIFIASYCEFYWKTSEVCKFFWYSCWIFTFPK